MLIILMSNSVVLCENFIIFNRSELQRTFHAHNAFKPAVLINIGRRQLSGLIPNAKSSKSHKRSWWQKFFLDEDWNWLGWREDDMLEDPDMSTGEGDSQGEEASEEEKFEAWKRRAEAITELREAQEEEKNKTNRAWEDWLGDGSYSVDSSTWNREWVEEVVEQERDAPINQSDILPKKGVAGAIRDLVFGNDEDELLYEDRVFRFASISSAKFLALLIIIPWALDFVAHDYVLMPFLDRYVKKVPLAAEILDVRRSQKLKMVKTLEIEKARFRFEVEIGKSPPLSDEEVWWAMRHKAIELRDEWRLENKKAFANIWSDMVFGISLFILVYFNQNKVALLKFTGYKLLNNISDTGKAFLIILVTDIFLGYHSESGWQTLIEIILEHYGLEIDQAAVTIFVCFIPVLLDACVKLWLFKFLPKLSPKVTNIFREMKRH